MTIVSLAGTAKTICSHPGESYTPSFMKKEGVVLALDLGRTSGWAVWNGVRIESGIVTFELKRGESSGMRFILFNSWLEDMISNIAPSLVVYEMAHHRGGYATELLLGLVTRVQEMCARFRIDYTSVHSATLKKKATGSGRASKEEMIKAAELLVNRKVLDDNEADAVMLVKVAISDGLV